MTPYVANGRNPLVTIGGAAASWDSKGNLTTEPQSGRTYGYSSENLLTNASAGVTLTYDPAMRLYQTSATTTARFLYDGLDPVAEYTGNNALRSKFVFDPDGQPIVEYVGTGTANRRFLGADERGSVISQTDSTGALLGIDAYDEYGQPGAANIGRFQYTGQMWLPEAGVYDYKARDYVPQLGVFAQADPIGYDAGANLYAYVLGDPVNFVDPLGLCSPDAWVCACRDLSKTMVNGTCVDLNQGKSENQIDQNPRGRGPGRKLSGPIVQPPQPKPTPDQCRVYSLRRNGFALGLDILGIAAEGILSEVSVPAGVIATAAIGAAGIGNSIAHKDWTGLGLAYGGRHAGMAEGFQTGRALSIVRGLSIIGLGVSTLRDFKQAKADYENCIAGTGAP